MQQFHLMLTEGLSIIKKVVLEFECHLQNFYLGFWLRFRLMQKLYWLLCVLNFLFPQSFYIWQLLTVGNNYPVPVDKHDRN